ncbi:ABC transporter substrate-binding protein [Natrialba sp. SSL1]|uniref:substrate-binding domain-containing protein n=1 Tax=Natrialba sp. SSL1 TaxID=1869245 RepID=UPI0008F7FC72|nr:ABC transporter substrate-binding protein [Natrialba sp. SSL1]OIB57804.1 branched-chain amino acid ABC transporter substrate-binding protein [Natrialba sp. SSL1]
MARHTTRRSVLKGSGATAAVGTTLLAGCVTEEDNGTGDPDEQTIRIGAFQPTSGDLEYYGQSALQGFYCGLAYKYDDVEPVDTLSAGEYTVDPADGPTFEIVLEDTAFDPDTARRVAEDLVVDEDVDILFGGTSSDSARRVIDTIVPETDIPYLCGPAADGDITVSDEYCHERVFRASEHTSMDARSGARYVAEEMDISTVQLFGSDNAFGRGGVENYTAVLEQSDDIEILEPRFTEVGYSEFEGMMDEAVDEEADAVGGVYTFQTLPQFIGTAMAYDVQIFGGFAELVTTQVLGGAVVEALGEEFTAEDIEESGLGPFTTRYHWNQYDNPVNDAYIDMNVETYEQVPDLLSAGTFTIASALVQALEEAEDASSDAIVDALTGMTVTDTPKGENGYQFREENNQAASEMTVAYPVPTSEEFEDTWDAPIMPGDPIETVAADEAMVPADEMGCDLS